MKRVGIIYFSGTGNTEFVANNIKAELEQNYIEADLINIEKDVVSIEKYEALIIGAPVYVERYPEILFEYIEKIPKGYKNKCMLFTTQGSKKPTTAFQHFINRVKYLNVTYCAYIPMPNNFANFMFKEISEEESKKLVKDSTDLCRKAVNNFLEGRINFYPMKKFKVVAINMVYKLFYSYIVKVMTRNIKIDSNKCVKCSRCEKSCPVGAIKIGDKVTYNKKCLLCQRCLSKCPKNVFYYKDKKYKQYKLEQFSNK